VQLGVYCNGTEGEFSYFGDFLAECGHKEDQFDYLFDSGRYTCYESSLFSNGSTALETQTIPGLTISTDTGGWVAYPDKTCFTQDRTPTNALVTASPSPTRLPVIAAPAPMITATSIPTLSPQDAPSEAVMIKSTTGSGPSTGAIVGGAIGAIVFVGIAAFLVIRWNAGRTSTSPVREHKDHSNTGSDTGRNEEIGFQHRPGGATQPSTPTSPSTQGELDSAVAILHPSAPPSLTGSTQSPSRPLRFKDQARTFIVEDVPLAVAGMPASSSPQRQGWHQEQEVLVAQPVDTDLISAATGSTRRSADPDGRRGDSVI
jgi:hypothetical protein